MSVAWRLPALLDSRIRFPNPALADREGLIAVGGDLSVPRLLLAYSKGVFPWTVNPITWWSPDPRAIIDWDGFHIPRSLEKILRRNVFRFTRDQAFADVIAACAAPAPGRMETWISPEFITAYCELHRQGHAHSVECWEGNALVGGIYGVAVGGFFAGESMFHLADNASKAALWHLMQHLQQCGFKLFDVQMLTPLTTSMGGKNIPRAEYLARLKQAVAIETRF
jgi:leucyl/phenylalanyl-tRNA---protein transferase